MHNILWEAYKKQLDARAWLPGWYRRRAFARYRRAEEASWHIFDGLIAINDREHAYAAERVSPHQQVFYAPMGISLEAWSRAGEPAVPPRVAYYGGLGPAHNQRDALTLYQHIMPLIWRDFPATELWIVGSRPPQSIADLAADSRVTVTGFVEDVGAVLETMTLVIIPWQGRYGFRSRVIEVMALGIPVITTTEAVYGMALAVDEGLYLRDGNEAMAAAATTLLADPVLAREQGRHAREQAEKRFSFQATYGKMAQELERWLEAQSGPDRERVS
jgi:glycosyltransferase involved in cell wall biosynthesis